MEGTLEPEKKKLHALQTFVINYTKNYQTFLS